MLKKENASGLVEIGMYSRNRTSRKHACNYRYVRLINGQIVLEPGGTVTFISAA